MYKKFPKICVLRTKLNWITQKQNQQKTMMFKKIHLSIFLEKKALVSSVWQSPCSTRYFSNLFAMGALLSCSTSKKIMKIIVVVI